MPLGWVLIHSDTATVQITGDYSLESVSFYSVKFRD